MAGESSRTRSLRLVGRRTRGYRLHVSRVKPGIGVERQGRRTRVHVGPLAVEWYPA
jgi:hypothetical protein